MNALQSRRFAKFKDVRQARQRVVAARKGRWLWHRLVNQIYFLAGLAAPACRAKAKQRQESDEGGLVAPKWPVLPKSDEGGSENGQPSAD